MNNNLSKDNNLNINNINDGNENNNMNFFNCSSPTPSNYSGNNYFLNNPNQIDNDNDNYCHPEMNNQNPDQTIFYLNNDDSNSFQNFLEKVNIWRSEFG